MKNLLFVLLAISSLSCFADDYKILYLNTEKISIGGKELKVGDLFEDCQPIIWNSEKQAMKVQNIQTRQIKLFTSKLFEKSNSISDYYLKHNHLSTRGDMLDENELKEYLSNNFYFLDSLSFSTYLVVDESAYFMVNVDGQEYVLPEIDGEIVILRSLFKNDEDTKKLDVFYIDESNNVKLLITDQLILNFLPLELIE